MAGFLGFGNYEKPGPGVGKDQENKKSFFLFFDIYFRKFWKLAQVNMLFFIFCIPFCIPYVLAGLFTKSYLFTTICMIPILGISIVIPGLTYVLRNFAREEHAFLFGDFLDTIKKNWRQSLIVGIIDFVVYFLMINACSFYIGQVQKNSLIIVPLALCFLFTAIFTFMQYYLWLQIITFDLKVKQIIKNAIIFAFAGLGRNIVITFFLGIVTLIVYICPFLLILLPFILISLYGFIIVFNAWFTIKKFMLSESDQESENTGAGTIFEDQGQER
jgi:uncharacterized membrane protein YesL